MMKWQLTSVSSIKPLLQQTPPLQMLHSTHFALNVSLSTYYFFSHIHIGVWPRQGNSTTTTSLSYRGSNTWHPLHKTKLMECPTPTWTTDLARGCSSRISLWTLKSLRISEIFIKNAERLSMSPKMMSLSRKCCGKRWQWAGLTLNSWNNKASLQEQTPTRSGSLSKRFLIHKYTVLVKSWMKGTKRLTSTLSRPWLIGL